MDPRFLLLETCFSAVKTKHPRPISDHDLDQTDIRSLCSHASLSLIIRPVILDIFSNAYVDGINM